jgi:hypothetical protein
MKLWIDEPVEQWVYVEQEGKQHVVMIGGYVRLRFDNRAEALKACREIIKLVRKGGGL